MIEKLVAMYIGGAITGSHLAVECLNRIDPASPDQVLNGLPNEIIVQILKYAQEYRPGRMRTDYGIQPAEDQVQAARVWIEDKLYR